MLVEILQVGKEGLQTVKPDSILFVENLEDAKKKTEGVSRDDCVFIRTGTRELAEMIVCYLCLRGVKNIIY